VVDVSDNVDISKLTVGKRVTLLSDSYKLEKMLPSSVRRPYPFPKSSPIATIA
jgi:hypothetical protein